MADYPTVLQEIYDLQEFAIKLGLENISAFCQRLGNPQKRYPIIHIAGTNGKGSTAFFIAQLLAAHGQRVGLFTSPHLRDYRERIRVNDRLIEPEFVVDFWQANKAFVHQRRATFFDTTTAMAFQYFAEQKVEVAVIETGLGGRLDSTNIVEPVSVVLTPVHFDHQKQLGDTLASIAREKAGIIKSGAQVFCAPQASEVLNVFKEYLQKDNTFFYFPEHLETRILQKTLDFTRFELKIKNTPFEGTFTSRQVGDFQVQNLAMATLVAYYFSGNLQLPAVQSVFEQKVWPARLQTVHHKPRVIFDVSHNIEGVQRTLQFVQQVNGQKGLHVLLGLLEHKDFEEIVDFIVQQPVQVHITEPKSPKKLSAEKLAELFRKRDRNVTLFPEAVEGVKTLIKNVSPQETILVMGSHYLIGDLMNHLSGFNGFFID